MKKRKGLPFYVLMCLAVAIASTDAFGQTDTRIVPPDSALQQSVEIEALIRQTQYAQRVDSIRLAELMRQIDSLKENEQSKRRELADRLLVAEKDSTFRAGSFAKLPALKASAIGYPVVPFRDTLFLVYHKVGVLSAEERAAAIASKIRKLYQDRFLDLDSLSVQPSEYGLEINYGSLTIMTVSEYDAIWQEQPKEQLADSYRLAIKNAIHEELINNSFHRIAIRVGLILLVLVCASLLIWGVRKLAEKLTRRAISSRSHRLKDVSYKNYTLLSARTERKLLGMLINIGQWIIILLILYFAIPLILSIFPFTQGWAAKMYQFILSPFRAIFISVWKYLPNLFTIAAIVFVSRYVFKFVRYIFKEIEDGRLEFKGFHADWAPPTYSIIRVLLLAFVLVIIFPLLPKSESDIFKGVSVFIGLIVSFGSSSAIANMVAGIVITYMRPFKIGDNIKIGEMKGDVIEKTLLVTRLRTVKNEELTIPNALVLSNSTTNYSIFAEKGEQGLIVYTSVTIGYDIPRKKVEEALLEAARRTPSINQEPEPFVLEQSLNDFHIEYQLNAYTSEANRQARVYSELRQHILDVFNERRIEIMSPNYHAVRDGNKITIPDQYLRKPDEIE